MPYKTRKRKEKVREKLLSQGVNSDSVKREFEFSFSGSKIKNFKNLTVKKSDLSLYSDSGSRLAHDLAKTLIVAIGIISLELVLYFTKFK